MAIIGGMSELIPRDFSTKVAEILFALVQRCVPLSGCCARDCSCYGVLCLVAPVSLSSRTPLIVCR